MAVYSVSFSDVSGQLDQRTVTINQTEAETKEVKIGNYIKVIKEKSQTINLTPYLMEQFRGGAVEPFSGGIKDSEGWGVIPSIEIDGVEYRDTVLFVPAAKGYGYKLRYSNKIKATRLPYLLYRPHYDLQLIVGGWPAEETIYANGEEFNSDEVKSFAGSVIPGYKTSTWRKKEKITQLGQQWEVRRFDGGANSLCLMWLNEYGVLDKWYFNFLRDKTLTTTSETIYTKEGYQKLNVQSEFQYVIETRELGKDVMDALSYILASPRVYICNEDEQNYIPIDIITEECRTYSDKELSTFQIAFRSKNRMEW